MLVKLKQKKNKKLPEIKNKLELKHDPKILKLDKLFHQGYPVSAKANNNYISTSTFQKYSAVPFN